MAEIGRLGGEERSQCRGSAARGESQPPREV
jgi:hypothetical protein